MARIEKVEFTARIVQWTEDDKPIWQPSIVLIDSDGVCKYHAPSIFTRTWREAIERVTRWAVEHSWTI